MKIYLAGPISGCSDDECIEWREGVMKEFPQSLDPMRRDYRGRERDYGAPEEIVRLDKEDIGLCDLVLAHCPFPSVGTSMEIFFAHSIGKPVLAVVPPGSPSSPWLAHHAEIYPSIDMALAAIRHHEKWGTSI
jgi:nucleoside 2-deoxyribosyltransferase